MTDHHAQVFECPICHTSKPVTESRPEEMISAPVRDTVQKEHPEWGPGQAICHSCLSKYRMQYIEQAMATQRGELTNLEQSVFDSLAQRQVLARNINPAFDKALTMGQRLADKIAEFGGSWTFIIIFGTVLLGWIAINSLLLLRHPFDPYPYILLNLVLSCLAAIQAPIIMMSQNRQEAKDRMQAEHDYQINLKAEIEIQLLHTKMDQLMNHSWQRLLEIQQVQIEMMEEFVSGKRSK